MPEFFDGDFPPAYFITFSTYGTRLHGDDRGTVNRRNNRLGEPLLATSPGLVSKERSLMKSEAVVLDAPKRAAVDFAIRERCSFMCWDLYALHVRTNHVHVVVSAGATAEKVMGSLKARATKVMRLRELIAADARVWTRHGSTRYLWNRADIEAACLYVMEGQGPDLPMR